MESSDERVRDLERLHAEEGFPWISFLEDRDFQSGSSFIRVGEAPPWGEDIYVSRAGVGANVALLDFIAALRNSVPAIVSEREARSERRQASVSDTGALGVVAFHASLIDAAPWEVEPAVVESPVRHRISTASGSRISVVTDSGDADIELLQLLCLARNLLSALTGSGD